MKKAALKIFSFLVDSEGTQYSKKFELDKNAKLVHGIRLSSDRDNLLYYRGSQRIEISGDEVIPEDCESKLMMSGIGGAPGERYYPLEDVVAGNLEVKFQYKDTANPNAPFAPYKVIIYAVCEMN